MTTRYANSTDPVEGDKDIIEECRDPIANDNLGDIFLDFRRSLQKMKNQLKLRYQIHRTSQLVWIPLLITSKNLSWTQQARRFHGPQFLSRRTSQ